MTAISSWGTREGSSTVYSEEETLVVEQVWGRRVRMMSLVWGMLTLRSVGQLCEDVWKAAGNMVYSST